MQSGLNTQRFTQFAVAAIATILITQSAASWATEKDATVCTFVTATFRVTDVPPEAEQNMHVVGNHQALGNWKPIDANQLKQEARDGKIIWSATLQLPPSTPIQYRFIKHGGGADVFEGNRTTYSHNRHMVTSACGAPPMVLDAGDFSTARDAYRAEVERILFEDAFSLPKGNIGARIQALVAAVNANNPATAKRFIAQNTTREFQQTITMAENETVFTNLFHTSGGIDFAAIRTYGKPPEQTTVLLKDRAFGNWGLMALAFDAGSEGRISGIKFFRGRPPAVAITPSVTETAALAKIRALVDGVCKKEVFSGTVLVARGDTVLVEKACGEASKRYHVRNNLETKFNVGSMNTMFTGVAIAKLIEQGKLRYDDTLDKFIDGTWLPKDITELVTVHHLLSHTSGLGNYFNEKFDKSSRTLFRELDDYKPLIIGDQLAFKPGTRFSYSNSGMLLLGIVIERASGENYFDYVRKNVFATSGMVNTDNYALDEPVDNLAMGHIWTPKSRYKWTENNFQHVIKGGPAGGGYSTVRDLHRFALALKNEKLVKRASLDLLWQDHGGAGFGYGFLTRQGATGRIVGGSGGFPGLNGQLDVYLDREYIVTALSNNGSRASPLANRIGELIAEILP